jgi:hypothetical protein
VRGELLRTSGTYRCPRAWMGAGAGDRSRPCAARAQRAASAAAERLSTRSNTWRFVSTLVQTPVGRPKRAYLAQDPMYRLFTMTRDFYLV